MSSRSESTDPLVTEINETEGVISEYLTRYKSMIAKYDKIKMSKGQRISGMHQKSSTLQGNLKIRYNKRKIQDQDKVSLQTLMLK